MASIDLNLSYNPRRGVILASEYSYFLLKITGIVASATTKIVCQEISFKFEA